MGNLDLWLATLILLPGIGRQFNHHLRLLRDHIRLTSVLFVRRRDKIEPHNARWGVNHYLGYHGTMMILAGDPTLHIGEKIVWRVPVQFAAPDTDPIIAIGSIDVDAISGAVLQPSEAEIEQMLMLADALATILLPRTN